MYSLEDRMEAIQRFLKYDRNTAAVIRELGFPSRRALREWVREYETEGALHDRQSRRHKYSEEQKQAAVKYYLEHGRNLQGSIRALGYPSKGTFRQWLDETVPDRQQGLHSKSKLRPKIELTPEQKQAAVVDLSLRDGSAKKVAEKHGVSRAILYKWKNGLLGKA